MDHPVAVAARADPHSGGTHLESCLEWQLSSWFYLVSAIHGRDGTLKTGMTATCLNLYTWTTVLSAYVPITKDRIWKSLAIEE